MSFRLFPFLQLILFLQFSNLNALVVHEWGTFTTLLTSEGKPLSGLYVDESRLPSFVYEIPGFSWSEVKGWPSPELLKNVTVKMETPVLYFYSDKQKDVSVKVGFKGGSISQWYPQRTSGESIALPPTVDFAKGYQGSIGWNCTILPPESKKELTHIGNGITSEWEAPRWTQSNLIKNSDGDIEKYLFYRGIGNFELPLKVRMLDTNRIEVHNAGKDSIAYAMIFETKWGMVNHWSSIARIWWQGPIAGNTKMEFKRNSSMIFSEVELSRALVQNGLYKPEANAMLQTWRNSYFQSEKGLKVLWIVPRPFVDSLLPLSITPKPDSLQRVLVGRTDILTPEYEQTLRAMVSMSELKNNKYYFAFQDFLNKDKRTTAMRRINNAMPSLPEKVEMPFRMDGKYFHK